MKTADDGFVKYLSQNGLKWLPSFPSTCLLVENNAIMAIFVTHSLSASWRFMGVSVEDK
ncbi:MAG: hypothetical protein IJK87_11670 [Prevotella sp.]|nr:hypothetical protein [Prevotella sp.]